MIKDKYRSTLNACFTGYVVQAIVNNFIPLLFVMFVGTYGITISKITTLIAVNFAVQMCVDFLSAFFVDKIGYRKSAVTAHLMAALGLVLMTVLPEIFDDAFIGMLISVIVYAVGGGLLEVLISPMVEALPTRNKEKAMSLLHSFYCWGHAAVVFVSTMYFYIVGIEYWKIITLIWAGVPLINMVAFTRVPILTLVSYDEGIGIKRLVLMPLFWMFVFIMICSAACEQSISQWASTFAERGLGISKTVGDLAGPMFFAILMGSSRTLYGKFGDRVKLRYAMMISVFICIVSYLMISLSPNPTISLLGCGICGFSVGIMWPGAFSMASSLIKRGGTTLFALLALGGDLGCSAGPGFVGVISEKTGDLNTGILTATVFPVLLLVLIYFIKNVSVDKINKD